MSADRLTEFVCNICGQRNRQPAANLTREGVSCTGCESSVRTRAIVRMLVREITGADGRLDELPTLRGIRGLGISDSRDYATRLDEKFTYRNTHYHKHPRFDLLNVPDDEWGAYDFVIASEVLEHVAPPAAAAFETIFRLLKPGGLFLFTVPYLIGGKTREHFPSLAHYRVVNLGGKWVLVNRTGAGRVETFEDLVFHGGGGATLELRVFTDADLDRFVRAAGFQSLGIYEGELAPFGIHHDEENSLPMVARKQPFALTGDALAELFERYAKVHIELKELPEFKKMHQTVHDWATNKVSEDARELATRAKWAQNLAAQLEERTRWAQNLEQDVAHHVDLAERFAESNRDLVAQNRKLAEEVARLQALAAKRWVKAGRKLGLVE